MERCDRRCEAEAKARAGLAAAGIEPDEALDRVLAVGFRNAGAAVGDAEQHGIALALRFDQDRLETMLDQADPALNNLFAYPAQSNFSGVKHPLDLVANARSKGWHVLLDAAAFVPTNRLDLEAVQPDFATICRKSK